MTQRLTPEQLGQIVAEVEQMQQRKEAELDAQQVKEILQELNLPPELLDEAIIQLRRRQALEVQQKRNRWMIGGIIATLVIVGTGTLFFIQQHNSVIDRVQAEQDRITLVQDDGSTLKTIPRQPSREIYYRVTLKDTPVGQKLNLSCNWIDQNGEIVKQNRYQTREIKTPVWNTYCRYTIGASAAPGNWKVQMFLEGRELSDETFTVQ
ncbi:MAG: DUF3859 domain-containing protein [Nostocaceae cyanobacterium]|nr:DUF3859 domain-containing protein [Nostocaceae cyanobacterium]